MATKTVKQTSKIDENREKLIADLKAVMQDAQGIIDGAKDASSDAISEQTEAAKVKLHNAVEAAKKYEEKAIEKARDLEQQSEELIRKNPWKTVAISAAAGLVIGRLLQKK